MQFELIQIISMLGLYGVAILMALLIGPILNVDSAQEDVRNTTLDGIRALAAVGVAASHINQYVCAYQGSEGVPHIGNHVGIVGVQMFFALTGYLFTERALKGKIHPVPFLAGRVRRIIPLYTFAVVTAIFIAVCYTRDIHASLGQTLKELLKVATCGFWNHHSLNFHGFNMLRLLCVAWTLSFEWAFYLLLVPAQKIWRKSQALSGAVLATLLLLCAYQFSMQAEQVIWPFFLPGIAGAILRYYLPSPETEVRRLLPLVSLASLILMITLPGYWTALKLTCALFLFLSILYSEARFFSWKPLQTLATISFSVYLLQYLLLCPVTLFIKHHPAYFSNPALKTASVFLVMFVLIPVACITYLTVERPFMSRRRARRLPAEQVAPSKRSVKDLVSSNR